MLIAGHEEQGDGFSQMGKYCVHGTDLVPYFYACSRLPTFPMDTGALIEPAIGLNEVTSVLNKRAEVPLLSQGMLSKSFNLAHDYPCGETTQITTKEGNRDNSSLFGGKRTTKKDQSHTPSPADDPHDWTHTSLFFSFYALDPHFVS
jgi:hypothetical protein